MAGFYEMRAASVCAFTVAGRCRGRRNAKPTRKMAYAARMPNAIAPIEAQTNIAKFNKSAIPTASASIAIASRNKRVPLPGIFLGSRATAYAIVAEDAPR